MATQKPAKASAAELVQALHRRRLEYRASFAHCVLLGAAPGPLPGRVPALHIDSPWSDAPTLVVDGRALPASACRFDDNGFHWSHGAGAQRTAGSLAYRDGRAVASGMVLVGARPFAAEYALSPVRYRCLLSSDAGAHFSTQTFQLQLHTPGISWDQASWVDAGLELQYSVSPGSGFGQPPEVIVGFADTRTGVRWTSAGQSSSMTRDLTLVYDAGGELPPADDRSKLPPPAAVFDKVLPLQMTAVLSADTQHFDAAIAVDGQRVPAVLAVRAMYIDERPPVQVLPAVDLAAAAADTGPDPRLLGNITPFQPWTAPDGTKRTIDVVQRKTSSDFYDILLHSLPDELLKFVSPPDPTTRKPVRPGLDADVQAIAELAGADGTTAAAFYQSVAVPYIVQALAHSRTQSKDPFAKKLNADRARLWMSQQTAASSVYNTQMPALYNLRFAQLVPEINAYVADQRDNSAAHAAEVRADATGWKAEVLGLMSKPSADDVKVFTDMVDELSALGANGHYWAYRLFRLATAPSILRGLQAGSMAPGQGNTSFAERMQGYCATLAMLDPSGTFTKRYAQTIALVQISNVFSQLIDYDGKGDALKYIASGLLEAFLERYADDPDPQVQQALAELQKAQHDGVINDLIQAFINLSSEVSGAYEWRTLSNSFKPAAANGLLFAADLVAAACAIGGLVMFGMGIASWKSLNEDQQANVVIGGIELFANTAISLVKRTVAIHEIFSQQGMRWETFKIAVNPFIDNLTEIQKGVLDGLVKRIVGQTETDAAAAAASTGAYRPMIDPDEAVDMTTAERWLGRNLDEFAIRLGVVFGVANVILSAIALSESTDPLDIASNSLFVAGAALETVTYAAGWFVQGALAVTEATLEMLSSVMSACTIVAAVIAIAGLIVAIVRMCQHQPTPLETFATTAAKEAGFFMALDYDVDSLKPYALAGDPSRTALALSGRAGTALRLAADGTVSIAAPDTTNATCLQLLRTGIGPLRIASIVPHPNSAMICLTASGGQLAALPYADPSAKNGEKAAEAQHWLATPVAAAQVASVPGANPGDAPVVVVAAGTFTVSPLSQPALYLDLTGAAPRLSASPVALTMAMVPVAPQGLSMSDVVLAASDRDRRFMPNVVSAGSAPRRFALAPALPNTFTFDEGSGIIAQVVNAAPALAAPAAFTLTCSNGVAPPASVVFRFGVSPVPAGSA